MLAAFIERTGPPDVIRYADLPDPTPGPTEVLVQVGAVAVNPIDCYIRNGANFWPLPDRFVIGCDLAGTVSEVGTEVTRFRVGDRVWGSNQGLLGRQGTFAQLACVDQEWLYRSPEGVSDEDLAATALVGITAHLGLFLKAGLMPGETVLVNGGSGGVGSMVVQMAKAAGARVLATAGSVDRCAAVRRLGADEVFDYHAADLVQQITAAAPSGIDLDWETVRSPDLDAIISRLADQGRVVLMAGRDARPEFPVGPFYVKGCSIHGFVMFKAPAASQRRCAEDIGRWLASGELKANIAVRMPLREARQAHELQEANTLHGAGTLAGKIVLVPES